MAGTPGSGFLSSRMWKACAIWISLPLISGLAKASFRPLSVLGRSSEEERWKIEPALKFFGGATGETSMMRPFLSARTMRSSSGVAPAQLPLPRNDTVPMPDNWTPDPEIEPVTPESTKGISAAWTEPATDFST